MKERVIINNNSNKPWAIIGSNNSVTKHIKGTELLKTASIFIFLYNRSLLFFSPPLFFEEKCFCFLISLGHLVGRTFKLHFPLREDFTLWHNTKTKKAFMWHLMEMRNLLCREQYYSNQTGAEGKALDICQHLLSVPYFSYSGAHFSLDKGLQDPPIMAWGSSQFDLLWVPLIIKCFQFFFMSSQSPVPKQFSFYCHREKRSEK